MPTPLRKRPQIPESVNITPFSLSELITQLTKMYDTSPESCVGGAVTAVGFVSNSLALCWQSVFEVCTSYTIIACTLSQKLPFGRKTNVMTFFM